MKKEKGIVEGRDIYRTVDHILLLQDAIWGEVHQICDDAMAYDTASVCIPPPYAKRADEYLSDQAPVCTVIDFPNGYSATAMKVFETEDVIKNRAAEIDMMIDAGDLKDKNYDKVMDEIRQIKTACGKHILRVIIETCLLADEKKVRIHQIVTESGADYIKTPTDFSKVGTTFEDIALFRKHVDEGVKIRAAGGIFSFDDAECFIGPGAERLGTSWIMKPAKAEEEGRGRWTADTDGY